MTICIERAAGPSPAVQEFLSAHLAELAPTAPPESRHALDATRLFAPEVRLFVVTADEAVVGTAALVPLESAHEELKSMRTAPSWRGRGVAGALVRHVLDDARGRGIRRVSLETGTADFFAPARRLYARTGFRECAPFGHYDEDPHSVFLTVRFPPSPRA